MSSCGIVDSVNRDDEREQGSGESEGHPCDDPASFGTHRLIIPITRLSRSLSRLHRLTLIIGAYDPVMARQQETASGARI